MPDFRVADTASEHPKLRAAGLLAAGLWSMAGSWSMNPAHMTDGWVPDYWVLGWPQGKKSAAKLVEVGLWIPKERGGQPGWQFHDWFDINRSAATVEDERRKARERMTRIRSGPVRPNNERTSVRTTDEGSLKVHDSLTLTQSLTPGENFGGARHQSNARPSERPPERCPSHENDERPPNCGACADRRRTAETWDRNRKSAVRACGLCDGDGYRLVPGRRIPMTPYVRCDHTREQALT